MGPQNVSFWDWFEIGLHPALCKTESKTLCKGKLQCNFTRLQEVYTSFVVSLPIATTTMYHFVSSQVLMHDIKQPPYELLWCSPSKFLFDDPQGRINSHQNKIPCWPPIKDHVPPSLVDPFLCAVYLQLCKTRRRRSGRNESRVFPATKSVAKPSQIRGQTH